MSRKRRIAVLITVFLCFLALTIVILNLDNWFSVPWGGDTGDGASTVYIDGVPHRQRKTTTYLIIGLDEFGAVGESESYNNTKHADFLVLLTFDHSEDSYSVLHLNRDTMANITQLGVTGEKTGERVEQLALAHTYGDGTHNSCRNTVRAVSELLYGLRIDHYISMTMDAVPVLNDYVGGVTVTVSEDMTEIDERLIEGAEVKLDGELALQYVRSRQGLEDSSNLARMERQKQYVDRFVERVIAQGKDTEYIQDMGAQVSEYTVTNTGIQSLNGMLEYLTEYSFKGSFSLQGESQKGEFYMEFYVDEISLKSTLKELYYEKE